MNARTLMTARIVIMALWFMGACGGVGLVVQGFTGWSDGTPRTAVLGALLALIYSRWFVRDLRDARAHGKPKPIVLEQPAELGLSWDDGGDLLVMGAGGVLVIPRGDQYWMDAAEARDWAAQLAAMADALDAQESGSS